MIRKVQLTVTLTGATGSGTFPVLNGCVEHIHVAPNASCDVVVTATDPDQVLLNVTSVSADTWYPVRDAAVEPDGTALTYDGSAAPVAVEFAVDGYVTVDIANGSAGDVVVTLVLDE